MSIHIHIWDAEARVCKDGTLKLGNRDNALGIWDVRCIEYGTSLWVLFVFNFLAVGYVACAVERRIHLLE